MAGRRPRLQDAINAIVVLLLILSATFIAHGTFGAALPSPVFSDGFESGNLSQWTKSVATSDQQQAVYAGAWAARTTSAGPKPAYVYKALGTPLTELYYDGRFKVLARPSSSASLIRIRTPLVGPVLTLFYRADSKLAYFNEVTGAITVGPAVTAGVWHELSIHVVINGRSSLVEMSVDGAKVDAFSKTDSLGTAPIGRVYLGDPAGWRAFDFAFDNQAIIAGAGGASTTTNDTIAPSVPAGMVLSGRSNTSVSLSWGASTDNTAVAGYDLWRDSSKITSTTGTSYTFNGLSCGTSYTLGVDAFDAVGNTSAPGSLTASTLPCAAGDTTSPSVPSGLVVAAATQSSLPLSWTGSTDNVGVTAYDVFRGGSQTGTVTGTSYTFTGLACGTTYTLGVEAVDGAGNVSGLSNVTASTTACSGSFGSSANAFYVSLSGSDSNPGTVDRPWKTIKKAMTTLAAGQTAYLRAGSYQEELSGSCGNAYNKLVWTTSGSANAPITISGYPGEASQVVLLTAIKLTGDYERLQNLVVDKNVGWSSFDSTCDGGPNVNIFGHNDTISGVEVRNSAMSGIYLEGAAGAELRGNWIHRNGSHWNLDHGIYWFSGPGVAANNVVQDNYANGIKVGPNAQSVLVTQNTVVGNGRSGVIVSGDTTYTSNNNTIANNILVDNGTGTGGGYGLRTYWETAGVGTGNNAYNNLIWDNSSGDSWFTTGGLADSDSLSRDPLFVNLAGGDLHLQSGSPAIDAADPAYTVSTDYDGNTRPRGTGPDIGAYER